MTQYISSKNVYNVYLIPAGLGDGEVVLHKPDGIRVTVLQDLLRKVPDLVNTFLVISQLLLEFLDGYETNNRTIEYRHSSDITIKNV